MSTDGTITHSVSASGTAVLVLLIVIGPIIYLCRWIVQTKYRHRAIESQVHKDEKDGRENLGSTAYVFGLVGYAIGIGNVWRFPYVISQNGGAAAVVAYLICAVFVAVPLFLYEMILGQYVRLSFVPTWRFIRPRWLSFGIAQFYLLFIAQSYFSVVITYTIPYIIGSCVEPLPWTVHTTTPQGYWENQILNKYAEDEPRTGPGPIQWKLATSLLLFWVITYFSVAFGKSVLAQITYVTVIMPVILMLILVIVTTQLEGASDGIAFYIGKFDASELGKLEVWASALSQILFSLSPGFGTAITYSSFVKPKEDVYRACIIVAVANSAFSLIGGFAVFSIVGHLSYELGVPVQQIASGSGAGLAFITIGEAMTLFGAAENVMSVLFFVMLFTLGLDSSYAWTESIVSAVEDMIELQGWQKRPTWQTTLVLSIIMFLFGLVFTTRFENEFLDVVDHFVGSIFLLIVCFFEALILNVDFGWRRLALALKTATYGNKRTPNGRNVFPTYLCRFDLHGTVPLATILLGIYIFIFTARDPYGGYPTSVLAWGWTLLAVGVAMIFLTIWKCDKGSLPTLGDDEKAFQLLVDAPAKELSDDEVVPPKTTQEDAELANIVKATSLGHGEIPLHKSHDEGEGRDS